MVGYVYILINPTMPGLLKIGMTTLTPEERARQLSSVTGVAAPYRVAYARQVVDCEYAERRMHYRLDRYRINQRREFFQLPLNAAIDELSTIAASINGPGIVESSLVTFFDIVYLLFLLAYRILAYIYKRSCRFSVKFASLLYDSWCRVRILIVSVARWVASAREDAFEDGDRVVNPALFIAKLLTFVIASGLLIILLLKLYRVVTSAIF